MDNLVDEIAQEKHLNLEQSWKIAERKTLVLKARDASELSERVKSKVGDASELSERVKSKIEDTILHF
jgi:hypothetical protein